MAIGRIGTRRTSNFPPPVVAPTAAAPAPSAPGQAAPGAPARGTTGNVVIHGRPYPVNAAGIVAEGPYKGQYPTQALAKPPVADTGGGTGQPGASVPGAPPRGTPGSVTVNGQTVKVNAAGIIETPGAFYGKYPAQVQRSLLSEAGNSVNSELLPRINEISRRQSEETARAGQATKDLTDRGGREVSNIAELYSRLGNFQGAVRDDTNRQFSQSKARTGTAYDQLKASLNQTYDGAERAGNAEASRMGLAGTNANATAAGNRDQQYLTQLAGVDKQAQLGATDNMQQGFGGLIGMMQQNAAQESAGAQTGATRQTNKAIADIMQELQYGMRDLDGQRSDIEGQRGGMIQDLVRALEEQQYSRQREQSQDSFAREMAEKNFGLDAQAQQFSQTPAPTSELDMLKYVQELMDLNGTSSPYSPSPAFIPGTLPRPSNPGSSNYGPGGPRGIPGSERSPSRRPARRNFPNREE